MLNDDPVADGRIILGKSRKYEMLDLHYGNRHGLITGTTGTGKTVTLQVLAEGFSRAGVPVFAADIKGDLSGIAAAEEAKEPLVKRAAEMGRNYQPDEFPVTFWDVFGAQGHPKHGPLARPQVQGYVKNPPAMLPSSSGPGRRPLTAKTGVRVP